MNYIVPKTATINYVDWCSGTSLDPIGVPNIVVDSTDVASEWLEFPMDAVAVNENIMYFCGWRQASAIDSTTSAILPWLTLVEDSAPAVPGWHINVDRGGDDTLIG